MPKIMHLHGPILHTGQYSFQSSINLSLHMLQQLPYVTYSEESVFRIAAIVKYEGWGQLT